MQVGNLDVLTAPKQLLKQLALLRWHRSRCIPNDQLWQVKVTVLFRGRMITHKELGFQMLQKFIDQLADTVTVEQAPAMEGPRNLTMLLSPNKKK